MKKNIPIQFFLIAFIWAWIAWMPLVLAGFGIIPISEENIKKLAPLATMIAAFGPGLGAFYCLRKQNGKGAIKYYLKGLFNFRFGWQSVIIPAILLTMCAFVGWILPAFQGKPTLPMLLPTIWALPVYILIMTFFGGGQEEIGWRGYILEIMEERLGLWKANMLLGSIWTIWHLPLFFIPGVSQYYLPFGGFALVVFGYTGVLAWVRQVSGKNLFACLFVHGIANTIPTVFPTFVLLKGESQISTWIWAILAFIVGIVLLYAKSIIIKKQLIKIN